MIAPISSALKWHSHEVTKMHANPLFACTKRRVFLFDVPGEKKVIFSGVRDGGADRALNKIVNPKANRILTCGLSLTRAEPHEKKHQYHNKGTRCQEIE